MLPTQICYRNTRIRAVPDWGHPRTWSLEWRRRQESARQEFFLDDGDGWRPLAINIHWNQQPGVNQALRSESSPTVRTSAGIDNCFKKGFTKIRIWKCSAASVLALSGKLWPWLVSTAAIFVALSINFASGSHTCELDAASFWFEPPAAGLPALLGYEIRTLLTGCSEFPRATGCTRARRCKRACRRTRDQVQRRLLLCHNSFFACSLLHSSRHHFGAACWAEKCWYRTDGEDCPTHHVWSCPFVSMSASCFFGVKIFDLDLWFQVNSVKYPIKCNSLGLGKRVSLSDFCPWWSSWSQLHCLHKCRASHQIEKTSRLRKLNRRCIIEERCAELESLLGSWFVFLMVCHVAGFPAHSLWISLIGWKKNATLQ